MPALSLQIESTNSTIIINDLGFYRLKSVVLGIKHGLIETINGTACPFVSSKCACGYG